MKNNYPYPAGAPDYDPIILAGEADCLLDNIDCMEVSLIQAIEQTESKAQNLKSRLLRLRREQ